MKLFAIHAPLTARAAPENVRAARTGFSLAGFAFGPLWLLVHGLWLAFFTYLAAWAVVAAAVLFGELTPGAAITLQLLGHLYIGLEGRAMRVRARLPIVDVIYARSALEAEKVFLERLFNQPRTRGSGALASNEVIGLFPEPGR